MNKYLLASLTGITVLAIATPVLAYQGNPAQRGPNYSPERHEAMEVVFAKNDYPGWPKLMEGKAMRLKEVVNTQAKFEQFAKAHNGGIDSLAKFRSENNLGTQKGTGYGRNR